MSGDARDFNNIETRAVIKFLFLQGKAPKEIHAILTEILACFLPRRAKDLSASVIAFRESVVLSFQVHFDTRGWDRYVLSKHILLPAESASCSQVTGTKNATSNIKPPNRSSAATTHALSMEWVGLLVWLKTVVEKCGVLSGKLFVSCYRSGKFLLKLRCCGIYYSKMNSSIINSDMTGYCGKVISFLKFLASSRRWTCMRHTSFIRRLFSCTNQMLTSFISYL